MPSSPFSAARRRASAAFTLVELLTVIAIIGVLSTLVFAAVGPVRARADSTKCLSNLRQIGIASQLYSQDNKGRLPSSSHQRAPDGSSRSWTVTLAAYLGPNFIGKCPSVPDHPAPVTYGWNDLLTKADGSGIPSLACKNPAKTMMVAELATNQIAEHFHFASAARGRVTAAMFKSYVNVECHGKGANYLFVDGHVETLAWTDVQTRLAATNSPFLKP